MGCTNSTEKKPPSPRENVEPVSQQQQHAAEPFSPQPQPRPQQPARDEHHFSPTPTNPTNPSSSPTPPPPAARTAPTPTATAAATDSNATKKQQQQPAANNNNDNNTNKNSAANNANVDANKKTNNNKNNNGPTAPIITSSPVSEEKNAQYQSLLEKREKSVYKMKGPNLAALKIGPSEPHEAIPCFKSGLLYRCVAGNVWAFYNDTQEYEMHVTVTCGAESLVKPLGKTDVKTNPDRTQTFSVVAFPGETEPFWDGKYDGFKCSLSAKPISAEYRQKMVKLADEAVQRDIAAVKAVSQSYDAENVLRACVAAGVRFVDPAFRPVAASLFREGIDTRKVAGAAWLRPTQFLDEDLHSHIVKFRHVEANDIDQGQLGDCWLLCAIAAVAEFPIRIERLFNHPTLSAAAAAKEERLGAYRITLNVGGWWTNVIVDDYLPTVGGKPCFARNVEDPAELWAALMEKAFAKVFGSYSAIAGGDALIALQDLTGYPISRFDAEWRELSKMAPGSAEMRANTDALFAKLVHYNNEHFLTIVNTPGYDTAAYNANGGKNEADVEERYKKVGLALGHAYTLIDVAHYPHHDNLQLCKIRNPWGNGTEWTGEWSDGCPNWRDPRYRDVAAELSHVAAGDGAFWMPFREVQRYFDGGGVCFSRDRWVDHRVRGAFAEAAPNVVLEVTVRRPVKAYITMSQQDKRAMLNENKAYKYNAIMISVCKKAEASPAPGRPPSDKYVVHLNSNTEPENPTDKYTFNLSRDHSMAYTFAPSPDPYLIIPRIHGNTGVANFTLGFISDSRVGSDLRIRFRQLDASNKVFANYPKFSYDANATPLVEAEYQIVDPNEFRAPPTKRGTALE